MYKRMNEILPILFCLYLFSVGLLSPALAGDFQVGQTMSLHATKPIGVPLHREPTPSFWKHVPHGSLATIRKITKDGRWLDIMLETGEEGWVVQKYLQPAPSGPDQSDKTSDPARDEQIVWSSPTQCEQVVHDRRRMVPASSSTLLLATWNVRWFPNGQPPNQPENFAASIDLNWLVCTIIWMNVDILAVQESLATPEARKAWDVVVTTLQQKTEARWRWSRQRCGHPDAHHIGFLWNTRRVTLSHFDSLWQLNAKAKSFHEPCAGGLRPGHYAWVKSRAKNGVDFHLIAVHLKSGPTVAAVEERHRALNRIDKAIAPLLDQDQDVVILGDLNTMGAGDRRSRSYELKSLRRLVAKEQPGFQDLPIEPQCTQYFRGRGGWLDHVLVTKGMRELAGTSGQVTGYCAVANCRRIKGDYPPAYRRLSDHCPVIFQIKDRDLD